MTDSLKEPKIALVTGASRGLGLAICQEFVSRGIHTIATARSESGLRETQRLFSKQSDLISFEIMDVTSDESVKSASDRVRTRLGHIDILVNNAGILPDNDTPGDFSERGALETPLSIFRAACETNTFGTLRVCQAFVPLMKERGAGAIVNISSLAGQLSSIESGIPAYRVSKTALNALTRILADELQPFGIACNSISPGWVKTAMGGPSASVAPAVAARQVVDLALCSPSDMTGSFLRDGAPIAW